MFRIGIDLGGTKIEGIVLDARGGELFRKRVETQQEKGYAHILNRIKALHTELAARIQAQPHTFGIGTPGAVSPRTGLLKNSNTVCMNGQPLKADLERILGRKIEIQNDANCFAMAEALRGAGRGKKLVFGVIMGTGCGGGMVYRGEVITGPQAIAGEWGHMSINPDGPLCYCGQRGCVETYISGGGLQARYAEQFGKTKSFKEIVKDYQAGDAPTAAFMQGFFRNFGRALANLITVLDPDIVVLGGGVAQMGALLFDTVREIVKQRVRMVPTERLRIEPSLVGDNAGMLGGIALAMKKGQVE